MAFTTSMGKVLETAKSWTLPVGLFAAACARSIRNRTFSMRIAASS